MIRTTARAGVLLSAAAQELAANRPTGPITVRGWAIALSNAAEDLPVGANQTEVLDQARDLAPAPRPGTTRAEYAELLRNTVAPPQSTNEQPARPDQAPDQAASSLDGDLGIEQYAVGDFARQVVELTQAYTTARAARRANECVSDRLMEAGAVRRTWLRVEPQLPALMAEAHNAHGLDVPHIAMLLGVTPSYVYRRLREHAERSGADAATPPPDGP